jgi:hypothetical protein
VWTGVATLQEVRLGPELNLGHRAQIHPAPTSMITATTIANHHPYRKPTVKAEGRTGRPYGVNGDKTAETLLTPACVTVADRSSLGRLGRAGLSDFLSTNVYLVGRHDAMLRPVPSVSRPTA